MRCFTLFAIVTAVATALPLTIDTPETSEHIVLLKPGQDASSQVDTALAQLGLHADHEDVIHVYNNSAFQGFTVKTDVSRCLQITALDSLHLMEQNSAAVTAAYVRSPAPWGLQRISIGTPGAEEGGLHSAYGYNLPGLGASVDIYVLDTGIYTQNQDFGGRAVNAWPNSSIVPTNPHGTHTSGIAGSNTYGAASRANLVGVQVLPGDGGSAALVAAGMDFVMQTHDAKKKAGTLVGSVINMSLQFGYGYPIASVAYATATLLAAGVHVVQAAGNYGGDACIQSPGNMGGKNSSAITVGSIGYNNTLSGFSNAGPCVDVYAPGEDILSTYNNATDGTAYLGGTSMSSPFVAGIVAAQITNNASLAQDPAGMKEWLKAVSLSGFITGHNKMNVTGGPMLLANNGVMVSPDVELQRQEAALKAMEAPGVVY